MPRKTNPSFSKFLTISIFALFIVALVSSGFVFFRNYTLSEVYDLQISNVGDSGATVSWRGGKREKTCLVLVKNDSSDYFKNTCFGNEDDLILNEGSFVHSREVVGLEPQSKYHFKILSNGKINLKSPVIEVETRGVPDDILPPYVVYGKVVGMPLGTNTVVYIEVGEDIISSVLSLDGGWSVDLSNYRSLIQNNKITPSLRILSEKGLGEPLALNSSSLSPVADLEYNIELGTYSFSQVQDMDGEVMGINDGFGAFDDEAASSCTSEQIWNGSACKKIEVIETVSVVGLDEPVESRTELDAIEKHFMKKKWADKLTDELLLDITKEKALEIQKIRQDEWDESEKKTRSIEFIISQKAIKRLEEQGEADVISFLINHIKELNIIWQNSDPKINVEAKLDRIIVAGEGLMIDEKTWEVKNEVDFNFWANDVLKGDLKVGNMPYDIDSRWAGLDLGWANIYKNFGKDKQEKKIDYGLLHELTHHLPVGDLYRYVPADGGNLVFGYKQDQNLGFAWSDVEFIDDHMKSPASAWLSPISAYAVLFHQLANKEIARLPQGGQAFEDFSIYGNQKYYPQELTIEISELEGFDDCVLLKEIVSDPSLTVQENPTRIIQKVEQGSQAKFENNKCVLELTKQEQIDAFPGLYLGIIKDGATFPIYVPRVLFEAEYWKDMISRSQVAPKDSYTISLKANKDNLTELFLNFAEYIKEGEHSFADTQGANIKFNYIDSNYKVDLTKDSTVPADTLVSGGVLDNYYYFVSFVLEGEVEDEPEDDPVAEDKITYKLAKGWNLISVPFQNNDVTKASELINYIKEKKQVQVNHVARFSGGRWLIYSQDDEHTYSNDFVLIPEDGYFIFANDFVEFELTGHFERGMNYQFSRGWNLFGVSSREVKNYQRASKFLKDNELLKYDTSVFSSWDAGLYETFLVEKSVEYGGDIDLLAGKAYFVKLL
jgi:hypothetical protein